LRSNSQRTKKNRIVNVFRQIRGRKPVREPGRLRGDWGVKGAPKEHKARADKHK